MSKSNPEDSHHHPPKTRSSLANKLHPAGAQPHDTLDVFDGSLDVVYEAKARSINVAIQDIGMGRYQWALFFVTGFGWYADNLWPIVTSLILAPVMNEFNFQGAFLKVGQGVGLLIGAVFWGFGCDIWGRKLSFNITLFITSLFGTASGGSPNSGTLIALALLWSTGVGGNLPVDSAVFLEFVPGTHQYLLTVLSVWWAIGQLVGSLIAWPLIANFSCPQPPTNSTAPYVCLKQDNMGWRYFLYTMGGINFVMWILRFFVFHLYESPKYLMGRGRDEEAVHVLRQVAIYNGRIIEEGNKGDGLLSWFSHSLFRQKKSDEETREQNAYWESRIDAVRDELAEIDRNSGRNNTNGNAGRESPTRSSDKDEKEKVEEEHVSPQALTSNREYTTIHAAIKRRMEKFSWDHIRALFATRKLAWSTSLLITIWALIGLAFPLYNSFVTYFLASRGADFGDGSTYITYRNQVILSVIGVPGAILAGWAVELPRFGRKGTLAVSTALTGVFLFASTTARTSNGLLGWNSAYSFTSNVMYGVLYAISPELFATRDRGTGNGLTALGNRICGAVAPLIGLYANLTTAVPIYIAAAVFIGAGVLALLLPFEPQGKTSL